jgi:hypothetical protein
MFSKLRFPRWLVGVAMMAVLECLTVAAIQLAYTAPAQAQYYDDRYQRRQRQDYRGGGFFQQLFGPFIGQPDRERNYHRPERRSRRSAPQHVDHSQAPPPEKSSEEVTPTTSILVMGDGMADWLAYGLEEAFSDSPEVAIVRKNKPLSGLIRYEAHGDKDWPQVAREILANEKTNYVVMMLGLSDRRNIREKDIKEPDEEKAVQAGAAPGADGTQSQDQDDDADRKAAAAPERKPKKGNAIIEFRGDRWAEVYSRRIDETIAALKSKGVPVFWVGLPSIRGTRSTADAVYLNDLYRERAERAGIVYIDIWDGFVDESGKYSSYGPDYEGQTRRLRSADGVFFTNYGARKLAHYVEREIRRYMNNHALQVLLPSGTGPMPNGNPAERPVVGPVLPLTAPLGSIDVLAGAAGRQPAGNPVATQVLVKGEAVTAPPGRADNFAWPPGSATANDAGNKAAAEQASAPAAAATVPSAGRAGGTAR